jgi:bacterioferritin-associated ferredoxin
MSMDPLGRCPNCPLTWETQDRFSKVRKAAGGGGTACTSCQRRKRTISSARSPAWRKKNATEAARKKLRAEGVLDDRRRRTAAQDSDSDLLNGNDDFDSVGSTDRRGTAIMDEALVAAPATADVQKKVVRPNNLTKVASAPAAAATSPELVARKPVRNDCAKCSRFVNKCHCPDSSPSDVRAKHENIYTGSPPWLGCTIGTTIDYVGHKSGIYIGAIREGADLYLARSQRYGKAENPRTKALSAGVMLRAESVTSNSLPIFVSMHDVLLYTDRPQRAPDRTDGNQIATIILGSCQQLCGWQYTSNEVENASVVACNSR